jgi:hypothetical protein
MAAPIKIDYVEDWIERLRARTYEQWRDSVSWGKWVEYLGRQFQDLENAFQSLLTSYDIDNSEGTQLATIGRIVGQVDPGLGDTTYRLFLRARIAANNSSGGPEEIYAVFRALYGDTIGLVLTTSPIKSFVLRVIGPITQNQAAYGLDFLRAAKESGARGLLEWQESATESLFMFDTGPGFDAGVFADAREA